MTLKTRKEFVDSVFDNELLKNAIDSIKQQNEKDKLLLNIESIVSVFADVFVSLSERLSNDPEFAGEFSKSIDSTSTLVNDKGSS